MCPGIQVFDCDRSVTPLGANHGRVPRLPAICGPKLCLHRATPKIPVRRHAVCTQASNQPVCFLPELEVGDDDEDVETGRRLRVTCRQQSTIEPERQANAGSWTSADQLGETVVTAAPAYRGLGCLVALGDVFEDGRL